MKRNTILTFLLALLAMLFSGYLMFHTFSYDGQAHEMRIATKVWSDFGAHIPLIRSFSYGPNLPRLFRGDAVASPLFPGEPIRYHFGFYALVGILEKLGVRIDWALNIPSALGFFLLLVAIFLLSYRLFSRLSVSLLSTLFFLFNGSLSFVQFFKTHTLADVLNNSRFPSFGPWDGGVITAFWNLNIYTNQRHLGLSFAIALALVLALMKKPKHLWLLIGVLESALVSMNYPAAAIAALFAAWVFLVDASVRRPLLLSLTIILPVVYAVSRTSALATAIAWQPGYLAGDVSLLNFWWQNLGLHLILIPVGLFLSPKALRRLFIAPLLLLFLLPNLLRFSPDMINNHKFFNFLLIIGNMFSAYAIVCCIRFIARFSLLIRLFVYSLISLFVCFSTLSGIIDLFPIINDSKGGVPDIAVNPDAQFFQTQTKPTDIVANSTWFYHPASLTGRSLYSGYTYFTWSYGYDQTKREKMLEAIYRAPTEDGLCRLLDQNNIAFVELNKNPESYLQPNWDLWNSLLPIYENPEMKLKIYSTKEICEQNPR